MTERFKGGFLVLGDTDRERERDSREQRRRKWRVDIPLTALYIGLHRDGSDPDITLRRRTCALFCSYVGNAQLMPASHGGTTIAVDEVLSTGGRF